MEITLRPEEISNNDLFDFSLRVTLEKITKQKVQLKKNSILLSHGISKLEFSEMLMELILFTSRDLEVSFFLSNGIPFFDERVFSMFSGVVYLDNWSIEFSEFVRRRRAVYPKVKKLKVNNLLNLFTADELVLLKNTFPNLEQLEYADCGSTEQEREIYEVFFGHQFSTTEDVSKIFKAASQPFEL